MSFPGDAKQRWAVSESAWSVPARPTGRASIRIAPQLRGRPVALGEARARGRGHAASFSSFVQESERQRTKAPLTLTSGGTWSFSVLPAPQLLPALLPSRLRGHRGLYSSRFIALERGSVSPTKRGFCRGMFQCLLNQSLSRKNLRWLLRLLSEESSAFHPSWPQNKAGFSVRWQVAALGSPVWKASVCIFLCHQKDLLLKAKKKKSRLLWTKEREKVTKFVTEFTEARGEIQTSEER